MPRDPNKPLFSEIADQYPDDRVEPEPCAACGHPTGSCARCPSCGVDAGAAPVCPSCGREMEAAS